MKRRKLVFQGSAALAGAGLLGACGNSQSPAPGNAADNDDRTFEWKMVTAWPRNFPALGTGAQRLAETITRLSGGRLAVEVFGAGEIVPAFEVFNAVQRGTAQMGHAASYYWRGQCPEAQWFCSVPFGMTATETGGWLYYGGGLELWRELYADFGLIPFPVGNSGAQMGGWFKRPVETVDDLRGLRIRMPGLGGDVMQRAGATTVNIPGSELFTALDTGTIDATDWVGPYNDLAFGLHQAANHYYAPGWQEPSAILEGLVNREAWETLPDDLREVVRVACQAADQDMLAEFTARNPVALAELRNRHGVDVRTFPDEVLDHLEATSREVLDELAARSELSGRIARSYREYMTRTRKATRLTETALLDRQ